MILLTVLLAGFAQATAVPPQGTGHEEGGHLQREAAIDVSRRPPQQASREHLFQDYDQPRDLRRALLARRGDPSAAIAAEKVGAVQCVPDAFAVARDAALVALVQSSTIDCVNTLFSLTGPAAGQIFAQDKMIAIAAALHARALSYAGDNGGRILQLIVFLRAGYFVQFYHASVVGIYDDALRDAIRPALDAFVANPRFNDVNDAHGQVLLEFVILIDSATENAHQLGTLADLLRRYGAGHHAYWYMVAATNAVFYGLFRGHQNADYRTLVQADTTIVDTLVDFVRDNVADVGSDREYLLANAGRELARFLQYPDPLRTALRPKVKAVIDGYPLTGAGASIHVATADAVLYYDAARCGYYGLCDFRERLAAAVLPLAYECAATLSLRTQRLQANQVAHVCATLAGEENYFHARMATGRQPVANDDNVKLEVVVFASSRDYTTYSGAIFGNSTSNGGIYLEGDPSAPGNQARFLSYVAEWMADFEIWNLHHEYIHYLDGRFDMHGGFADYPLALPGSAVWYIEGLAEYLSWSYRYRNNIAANAEAASREFALSQIFDNVYASGQARVYRWGYLSVRYLVERRPAAFATVLGYFRAGDYPGYRAWLAGAQREFDADWADFLNCLGTHAGDTSSCGGVDPLGKIFFDSFEAP